MIINHNLPGMNAINKMNTNAANASKSMQKLSSGLRINSAADDAAGLAISEKMKGQIRGLDQASSNAQDGISMISTGEGALSETQSILQRMRELSVQSANDTNTGDDRTSIQTEMNQLSSEVNRIGNTTEFNTQKLLKGTNQAAVTTAQAVTTDNAGVAGVVQGATTDLAINAKSVKAVASEGSVQAATSGATGTVSTTITTSTASVAGAKASVSLSNGLTFTAKAMGTTLNGTSIKIVQSTTSGAAIASNYDAATHTIVIGSDGAGNSVATNRGDLYNAIKGIAAFATNTDIDLAVPASTDAALTTVDSQGTLASGKTETQGVMKFSITKKILEDGDTVTVGGRTFTARLKDADYTKGEFNITTTGGTNGSAKGGAAPVTNQDMTAVTSGMSITVDGGTSYTITSTSLKSLGTTQTSNDLINALKNASNGAAKLSDVADITLDSAGKINITSKKVGSSSTIAIDASAGAGVGSSTAINNLFKLTSAGNAATAGSAVGIQAGVGGGGTTAQALSLKMAVDSDSVLGGRFTLSTSANTGELVLKEKATQAAGTGLSAAVVKGSGTDDKLIVDDTSGKNLKKLTINQNTTDSLAVSVNSTTGDLTISLANKSTYLNTAAEIQAKVQALGVKNKDTAAEVDFSNYTFKSTGNWDTNTDGSTLTAKTATLVGGTAEQKGDYSFNITKAFAAGDVVDIKGQTFKAVASGAVAANGEFNIASGDTNSQAAGLRDAISLNSALKDKYTAGGSGNVVNLTETKASGTDLTTKDLSLRATGTPGQYEMNLGSTPLVAGAKVVIDGNEISVSDKSANVGYANGTAIQATEDSASQTSALANAINTNTALKDKYTASVDTATGNLLLTQKDTSASSTAPDVKTISSTKGDFSATMQIGANTAQSLTVSVSDMRSAALGITGDGSSTTVAAKSGAVASYVSTANVTDGTSNTNTEFSLDISTSDKATAAISVLDDAISAVSTQRAKLGAYQNRLEHTIANLGTSSENLTTAQSRITDVDMAKEMSTFSKNNILSQAAQAMLAQANQQPQQVLQLLR